MYRTAAEIDRAVTAGSLRSAVKDWVATEDTWFDGTVASVDKRIAACRFMLGKLRGASGRYRIADSDGYLEMTHTLEAAKRQLEALHDHLFTVDTPPPPREASVHTADPRVARFVELESQRFIAAQAGTYGNDIDELRTRASNYVVAQTSTWDAYSARVAQINFVNRVEELGTMSARQHRTAGHMGSPAYRDFDDILLTAD